MGNLVFQATLGGQVNLVGPNTASTFNLNVPATSSTIATLTGTETFTNKTLTSPTLTTPILGTPTSGTLTNCTGLPNAGLVNSSVTVGSTVIALGATSTTLAGLTSVASNTLTSAASTALTLQSAGTTALTIDTSQNVGIGTASPATKLNIATTGADVEIRASTTTSGNIRIGFDASGAYYNWIQTLRSGGAMQFATDNTERMRIDSSGNLLIGYTSSNGSYKLQVNSQIFATSSTIATSDARYKENVEELSGALDIVKALRPVSFDWKAHPIHNFDTTTKTVGFLAQDVQQVLADKPYLNSIIKTNECVIEPEVKDKEGNVTKQAVTEEFLGIAEGNMISILTAAIKELKAEFDEYKATHP
jgi:hypothetical protein